MPRLDTICDLTVDMSTGQLVSAVNLSTGCYNMVHMTKYSIERVCQIMPKYAKVYQSMP